MKRWKLLSAVLMMMLLLTACGKDKGDNQGNANAGNPVEQPGDEGVISDPLPLEPDNNFLEESTEIASDTQNYSIHVLPQYKLTGEEPGKDVLYLEENDSHFMRIETFHNEESITFNDALNNMKEVLEAASNGQTPTELKGESFVPDHEGILQAATFTVDTNEGAVTGVVFEREGFIVKLTIFESTESQNFNDFLQMGETIIPQ